VLDPGVPGGGAVRMKQVEVGYNLFTSRAFPVDAVQAPSQGRSPTQRFTSTASRYCYIQGSETPGNQATVAVRDKGEDASA